MGMGEASNALVSLATLAFVPKREPSPLPQEASCSALAGGMYGAAHCWAVLSGPKELLPGLGWTWVAFFPSHPVPQLPAVWKGRQEVPCWLSRGSREAPATPALFRWCCRQRSQLRSCSHRARSPRGDPARRRREDAPRRSPEPGQHPLSLSSHSSPGSSACATLGPGPQPPGDCSPLMGGAGF